MHAQTRGRCHWKFKNALLGNNKFIDMIKSEIFLVQETYALPVSDTTFVALDNGET